ncbi:TPA: type I-F CRISPR-associated protein Csy3 [Vibrio parahaemolyticus]|uniref:type I-F CRISPR-associated protein Csy3 n=1 Tax=Vibrio parahaemolyticus TaxID=670 RepID=UPI00030CEE62|nr:type I-F CRISPR-associated protein Csy3 [Vibrio parahaemolyticus]EGQ8103015.1 type I-F CRISPR-associated protein Csy3 [Vibrio parahaemolyticus]EJE4185473.1 type I-F CRISPR-associated protein Csy3 [Vibrio parahaemolyticus]ELA6922800.1 type I-F CRISPR-associated protein Csy3 [Vibrio parahaemolyticus]MBY3747857.1 type I-F CRISPR-associated protein Csy3 [Vibrio parahaemolyticus]MBY3760010.1 type I-F CRISPR-associated protein Csy3 [Vibrio parahaemolyticus]
MAKNNDTASVLAFEKKLVPSDGYLYGTNWDTKDKATPLVLQEKSVRGTISNRLKAAVQKDPLKLNAEVEKANLQRVDACALGQEQDTLKLHFTLKVLGGLAQPSACNNALFKQSYSAAVNQYISKYGCSELAQRYATNIANARFLWRNRVGAEDIEVQVKALNKGTEQSWTFNAKEYKVHCFDHADEQIKSLAERIAQTLSSESEHLMLQIDCYAKVGNAQEVYPSEELVLDKGNSKSKKSKILYAVNDNAAMHSQKIGNALRSIDTWYPDFTNAEKRAGAIAIEPYGAVTNLGKAFRTPKDKQDFYTFFDKWARGEALSREEDEHYVVAVLVRGGVFGESDK